MKRYLIIMVLAHVFWTSPAQNNALNFNGIGNNVTLTYSSSLDFSGATPFSIEGWFNTASNNWYSVVLVSNLVDVYPFKGYEASITYGRLRFSLANTTQTNWLITETLNAYNDGNWHHFACVYHGTPTVANIDLYVDGALQAQNVIGNSLTGSINNNHALHMGCRNNTAYFLKGDIDEIRIWGKALCASEVTGRMNCQLAGNETALLAYYDFNQGQASSGNAGITTLPDISGNNLPGTLTSFSLSGQISNWVVSTASLSGTCIYSPVSISGNTIVCAGNSNVLTASGATSYTWNTSANTASISVSPTASVIYTVTGDNITSGCLGSATVAVSVSSTSVSISGNTIVCEGSSGALTASGASSYTWSNSATTPSILVSSAGNSNYTVTGNDAATGCNGTATIAIVVSACTGIQNQGLNGGVIMIYPNPSTGIYRVEGLETGSSLEIYNVLGALVYGTTVNPTGVEVNITGLSNGVYILKGVFSGQEITRRLIKE